MSDTLHDTGRRGRAARRGPSGSGAVGPWLLWFGVLGGVLAWGVHLAVAWFVLEVSCISPTDGPWQDNRGGSVDTGAWALVTAGTALPWLVAATAVVACLVIRRRTRRLANHEEVDPLAGERTAFLVVLGLFLNFFALAAITGGIVAELTLDACG